MIIRCDIIRASVPRCRILPRKCLAGYLTIFCRRFLIGEIEFSLGFADCVSSRGSETRSALRRLTLIKTIFKLAHSKIKGKIVCYEIQFLSCSSQLTDIERKKVMRKHRLMHNSDKMAPAQKKQKLEMCQMKLKSMATEKKQKLLKNKRAKYQYLDQSMKEDLLTKKMNYRQTMGEKQKEKYLENRRAKYQDLDQSMKDDLLTKNRNYKQIIGEEQKEKLLENRRAKYQDLDQSRKEDLLTKNMNYRQTMGKKQKEKDLENRRAKYQDLDQPRKDDLLTKNMNYKQTMGEEQKEKLLGNRRAKYNAMDILMKKELVSVNANRSMEERMALDPKQKYVQSREKEQQLQNKSEPHNIDMYIEQFKKQIKAGPFYICCVCNRTLYKKSVIILKKTKYSVQNCFMVQCSFDGNEYICKTCHTKLLKSQLPCQAAVNDLFVDETPAELAALEKLEQILIAQRIVFEKIVIMPKGQQRKIKVAICNVPVECNQTCTVLPRPPDRSGIILLNNLN